MKIVTKNLKLCISIIGEGEFKEKNIAFFEALDASDFNMDYNIYYVNRTSDFENHDRDCLDLLVVEKDGSYNTIFMPVFRKMLGEKIIVDDLIDKEDIARRIEDKLHLSNPINLISENKWYDMQESTRMEKLILKEIITLDEFSYLEEHEKVLKIEDNGMSGKYIGYHWYSIFLCEQEHQIYVA